MSAQANESSMQMEYVEEAPIEQALVLNSLVHLSAFPNEHKDLVELMQSEVPPEEVVVGCESLVRILIFI